MEKVQGARCRQPNMGWQSRATQKFSLTKTIASDNEPNDFIRIGSSDDYII